VVGAERTSRHHVTENNTEYSAVGLWNYLQQQNDVHILKTTKEKNYQLMKMFTKAKRSAIWGL
jgi:hypothetical protein